MQNRNPVKVTGPQWAPWSILSPNNRKATGRTSERTGSIGARIAWRGIAGPVVVIPGGLVTATWRPDHIEVHGATSKAAAYQNGAEAQPDPTGFPVDADLMEGGPVRGKSKAARAVADALGTGRIEWHPEAGEMGPGFYHLGGTWGVNLDALGECTPGGGFAPYFDQDHDPKAVTLAAAGWRIQLDDELHSSGGRRIRLAPRQVRDLVFWLRRLEGTWPELALRMHVAVDRYDAAADDQGMALEIHTAHRMTGEPADLVTRYDRDDSTSDQDRDNRRHATGVAPSFPFVSTRGLRLALETLDTPRNREHVQVRLPKEAGQPLWVRHDLISGAGAAVILGTTKDARAIHA